MSVNYTCTRALNKQIGFKSNAAENYLKTRYRRINQKKATLAVKL